MKQTIDSIAPGDLWQTVLTSAGCGCVLPAAVGCAVTRISDTHVRVSLTEPDGAVRHRDLTNAQLHHMMTTARATIHALSSVVDQAEAACALPRRRAAL